VQFLDEFFCKRIALSAERPVLCTGDVFLFGFIELAAIGDIGRDQLTRLLRRERRGMVRRIEQNGRGSVALSKPESKFAS
jgi:hypothetical protein